MTSVDPRCKNAHTCVKGVLLGVSNPFSASCSSEGKEKTKDGSFETDNKQALLLTKKLG